MLEKHKCIINKSLNKNKCIMHQLHVCLEVHDRPKVDPRVERCKKQENTVNLKKYRMW